MNVSKGFIDSGIVSTSGDHIANLMMNDVRVGVSSRGVGSLKKQNNVILYKTTTSYFVGILSINRLLRAVGFQMI